MAFPKFLYQTLWQWRGVAIATPTVTLLVLLLRTLGLLQAWEWAAYDQFLRWRPPPTLDSRIAIVGLNETDVTAIGQAIVPDQVYAELITKLQQQSPRAIGLDVYRDLPVEPGHAALVEVFNNTPNLVGIQKVIGVPGFGTIAPPAALKAQGRVGSNDLIVDGDNVMRRGLISLDDSAGETVYSFPLYLALLYLEFEGIGPRMVEGGDNFWLGKALFTPLEANSGGYVRADTGGYQLLLNPVGPAGSFETVSVMDVLNDAVPHDWATDRIVLIGAVSESFNDSVYTAYSSGLVTQAKAIPGVELHANVIQQIVGAALGERSLIRVWPEWMEWLWMLLWSAIGSTLAWQFRRSSSIPFIVISVGGAIAPLAILLGSTYGAILAGWWIPIVPAGLGLVGSAVAVTGYVAQTANSIRKTFGRYLGDEIVDTLLEDPQGLKMGGERRHITILTSDVRGFTSLSEQLAPEEVIKILNFYLEHMADVITHYGGIIDDFIGDGILVVFGAPTSHGNDAERAIACALDMQLAMTGVNQTLTEWGFAPLEMGIGINTGEAVVGNMGSIKRTKYSVIGSHVNLAFRIETYTTGGQILISEHTLHALKTVEPQILSHTEVMPKGVKTPVTVYEVEGITGEYDLRLLDESEEWMSLTQPLSLIYTSLKGKQVADVEYEGAIAQLSPKGAIIQIQSSELAAQVSPLSNLKLNFLPETGLDTTDIYAKVLTQAVPDGHFAIRFTTKPPVLEQVWKSLSESTIK